MGLFSKTPQPPSYMPRKSRKGPMAAIVAAAVAIGAPYTMHEEGLRIAAYYDSVGVPTICYGETEGVQMGDVKSEAECSALFYARYGWFATQAWNAYDETGKATVTPQAHAAFTDTAYNIGVNAFKKSSMVKNANAGNLKAACDSILKYKFAGGVDCSKPGNKVCPGVWKRRLKIHDLCLSGGDGSI